MRSAEKRLAAEVKLDHYEPFDFDYGNRDYAGLPMITVIQID